MAYQHLLEKFLHLLTNLVLIHRDAYLKHAHHSLDAYRLKNLRSAPISGPELFDRSLMQEYKQHLIGLGGEDRKSIGLKIPSIWKVKEEAQRQGERGLSTGRILPSPCPSIPVSRSTAFLPTASAQGILWWSPGKRRPQGPG